MLFLIVTCVLVGIVYRSGRLHRLRALPGDDGVQGMKAVRVPDTLRDGE